MSYTSNFRLKLTIEYDGSHFYGWQIQPGLETVQKVVEETLKIFFNAEYKKQGILASVDRVKVKASGRTDRGVHALGQVISFSWPEELEFEPRKLMRAINGISPRSISFLDVEKVPDTFDAQYSAIDKHYRYCISRRTAPLCLEHGRAWRVGDIKEIESIKQCLNILRGTHDFVSFRASDCVARTTIRTLVDTYLETSNNDLDLELNFIGTGFLKNMVRYLVATIVEVARGNKDISYVQDLLNLSPKDPHIKLAPPDGLYLIKVRYPHQQML